MNILLLGADGFIGRHLDVALRAAGHAVVRGVRHVRAAGGIGIDYRRDHETSVWRERLAGIDVVINTVGILSERQKDDFLHIHTTAPLALFSACRAVGVRKVVHISALGADTRRTAYLASKADADDALSGMGMMGVVVRPGLVFGSDGTSSRFFLALASLPLHGLPGDGQQLLRPIHIDDLCELVLNIVATTSCAGQIIDAVGGKTLSYRELLACYRQSLGLRPAATWRIPWSLLALAVALGEFFPKTLLRRDTLRMLRVGNYANDADTRRLLGRAARSPAEFLSPGEQAAARGRAFAAWRTPLLKGLLAFLWLWSGVVSLLWPDTGLALLATLGVHGGLADATLLGAAMTDMFFGVLTLWRPSPRLWLAQGLLIVAYSLIVALLLGEFLLHPFAPIVKNIFVLATLFLLWAEGEEIQS